MLDMESYRDDLNNRVAQATGDYSAFGVQPAGSLGEDQPQTPPVSSDISGAPGSFDPASSPKNIDVVPPGFQPKFDETKLKEAKSVGDYVDAMKPTSRNEFMNWYEKQYGSITDKYNQMIQEIGPPPDAERALSKKDKWVALMNFGISLIKNSSNPNNTLVGSLAQSAGETVQGIQQGRQLEQQQYGQKVAAANAFRDTNMKNLGSFGDALKGQGTLDADQAKVMEAQNKPNEVKSVEDTTSGLVGVTNNGQIKPLTDAHGNPLRSNPSSAKAGGQTTYMQEHDALVRMYRNSGMAQKDADAQATKDQLNKNKKGAISKVQLRERAEKYAKQALGSPKDWRPSRNGGKTYQQAMDEQVERNYKLLMDINKSGDDDESDDQPPAVPPANRPPLASFKR